MLRLAFPVTLRQELFILSSGHHLRRTPRLPTIKLFSKLLRSLTARRTILPPSAPSKSLSHRRGHRPAPSIVASTAIGAGPSQADCQISTRAKYRASSLTNERAKLCAKSLMHHRVLRQPRGIDSYPGTHRARNADLLQVHALGVLGFCLVQRVDQRGEVGLELLGCERR